MKCRVGNGNCVLAFKLAFGLRAELTAIALENCKGEGGTQD